MATQILEIYKNEEDGIESHVAKIDAGYSVTLFDTDCGLDVGVNLIYKDVETAKAKAKEII